MKVAAGRIGVTLDEWMARRASGEKWCFGCNAWIAVQRFNRDASRGDGLSARCVVCTRVKLKANRKGRPSAFKGRTHTAEAKAKLSAAKKGRPSPLRGRTHTLEARQKMSATRRARAKRGPEAHTYKDGRHAERMGERVSPEYKHWRFDVMVRDKFTCQDCGDDRGGNLCAHHIKPFADFPELRTELSNGVTLCETCHKARHASGNL